MIAEFKFNYFFFTWFPLYIGLLKPGSSQDVYCHSVVTGLVIPGIPKLMSSGSECLGPLDGVIITVASIISQQNQCVVSYHEIGVLPQTISSVEHKISNKQILIFFVTSMMN